MSIKNYDSTLRDHQPTVTSSDIYRNPVTHLNLKQSETLLYADAVNTLVT